MKFRTLAIIAAMMGITIWIACSQPDHTQDLDKSVHQWLTLRMDSLETGAEQLLSLVEKRAAEPELQQAFKVCRQRYKQMEWFSEYYAPATSRQLNGPPLPEIEIEENKKAEPAGLQVIEELLFPYDSAAIDDLLRQVKVFRSDLIPLRHTIENTGFDTAHIVDACKLEIFRIEALGISGFDTPLSGWGIAEAGTTLLAVKQVIQLAGAPDTLLNRFDTVIAAGRKPVSDGMFDYATYMAVYLDPLAAAVTDWFFNAGLRPLKYPGALNTTSRTMFDSASFNISYFVHAADAFPTPEKVALGKMLFYDTRLAGNQQRSCNSCHQQDKAFTDGMPKNVALNGKTTILRNTPTLLYAGLQQAQFYDMRAPTLENQVLDVLHNEAEMHSSADAVVKWLNEELEIKAQFKAAFPDMEDTIRPRYLMQSIAAYIRQLHPFRSKFDRYMRGELNAINEKEKKGFNLFMGKGRCATCHFLPLFNGTAAPVFATTESEVLGVLRAPGVPQLDPDEGRYVHTKMDELKYAFKTPTLRNIALTAPYMHNGAFRTLEEVMEFYNKGGAAGYGITLPGQTLSPDSLQLSDEEKKNIIAFMRALTDN
ncbi:cytochrome C peroxidase [Chitinophaga filiformis]|uniref:cytochrome-c peroxidase n=1 Tax=Chitinophaga filiformis TaxID=104663 RepID=UPI001F3FEA67|nr:cytochrome c peroxidase [Chitinophaga filiformis]MCF6405233.1 cytochrome C peroxidase [Chitinophaga filiformis]